MGFSSWARRLSLLVVVAAVVASVAAVGPAAVDPAADPITSRLDSTRDVPSAQQAAGGGLIPNAEAAAAGQADAVGAADAASARSAEASAAPTASSSRAGELASNVRVTTVDALYDVIGADHASIMAALRRQGPRDGSGAWAGSLAWTFNWSYQPVMDGGTCRVDSASIHLRLTYTLPRLASDVEPSPVVREAWERFQAGLRDHEDGHAALAVEAANALVHDVEAAPAASSCAELRTVVETTVQAGLARHERAQVAYDRQTRHGGTQGATFSYADAEPTRP